MSSTKQDLRPAAETDQRSFESRLLSVLREGGFVEAEWAQAMPPSLDRQDPAARVTYRVGNGSRPRWFVTVGRDLADLARRSRSMARLFPKLAPGWGGRLRMHEMDVTVAEWLPSHNVEQECKEGRINPNEVLLHAERVQAELEASRRPSTVVRMRQELEQLLANVERSPAFDAFDKAFLRLLVFPFLRHAVERTKPESRWSNGDFCARNVVVDADGRVRLVDHEFAGRTHFFAEDWWRWRTFSQLPESARMLNALAQEAAEPWVKVLFLLRQMVLAVEINGARAAQVDAPWYVRQIVEAVDSAYKGLGESSFLRQFRASENLTSARAQWFWSRGDQFTESDSVTHPVIEGDWAQVKALLPSWHGPLHVRLDPVDAPGIVLIRRITIKDASRHVCVKWDTTDQLMSLTPDWLSLRFPTSEGALCMVVLHDDPILSLPIIGDFKAPQGVSLEAEICWFTSFDKLVAQLGSDRARAIGHTLVSFQRDADQLPREIALARRQVEEAESVAVGLREELRELGQSLEIANARETDLTSRITSLSDSLQAAEAEHNHFSDEVAVRLRELREQHDRSLAELTERHAKREAALESANRQRLADVEFQTRKLLEQSQAAGDQRLAELEQRARFAFECLRKWEEGWPGRLQRVVRRLGDLRHPGIDFTRLQRTGHVFNLERPGPALMARSANPAVIAGWFVDAHGSPAKVIRVRNGASYHVAAALERPDVASHFREKWPNLSERLGFQVEVPTGVGPRRLVIEAETTDGEIVRLGERIIWMRPYESVESRLALPGDDDVIPPEREAVPVAVPDVKAIAFYLPQFHAIKENDEWWGPGFTEWSNVRPAEPQFAEHYQPHEPHPDLGYYDLTKPEILERQAALARSAGIYGFCYYYYWFGGKRLLERPLDAMLASGRPEMPFCFCWANEHWSRRWDGREREILIAQSHSPEDDLAIIADLARGFSDQRYIRIEGAPLLLVYRPALLPDACSTFQRWRDWCRDQGIGPLHLAGVKGFGCDEAGKWGLDSLVEFPPNDSGAQQLPHDAVAGKPDFEGKLFDYRQVRAACLKPGRPPYRLFRGVMPSWDNTARRKNRGSVFVKSSPGAFANWLRSTVARTREEHDPEHRIVFINAWNEWAEGCHLEPDCRYG